VEEANRAAKEQTPHEGSTALGLLSGRHDRGSSDMKKMKRDNRGIDEKRGKRPNSYSSRRGW